jgi:glycosyltransferase involved in cell wall biosynthesis
VKVFNIAAGLDTGGQMVGMQRAFSRHSKTWKMSSLATTPHRFGYPQHIKPGPTSRETRAVMERLWVEADVVHVHRNLLWFAPFDAKARRPIVLNHHGTAFRAAPEDAMRLAKSIGAVSVGSTIDLLNYSPDVTWLPAPFDVNAMLEIRRATRRSSKVVRIAHAPSDRRIKSTPAVEVAVRRLAERYPIEFDLIENVPWAECLRRKARADIVVDQLTLGYGCNAVEAWSMGIPVIAGTTNPETRERMVDILGSLPFYEATEANLYDRLEELVADKELRVKWGRKGLAYARRWHDDRVSVPRMEALYERAVAERLPVPLAAIPTPSPKNRLVQVRDHLGRIRLMTPVRAKIRGFEVVAA